MVFFKTRTLSSFYDVRQKQQKLSLAVHLDLHIPIVLEKKKEKKQSEFPSKNLMKENFNLRKRRINTFKILQEYNLDLRVITG